MAQPGGFGERLRRLFPALWLGVLLAIALIAAPTLFAQLERAAAGRVAGRLFALEAQLSLALCIALGLIERRRASLRAAAGHGSRISAELLLVLGALFCTVCGQFALQPLMEAARAGEGRWSFGVLHAVSVGFYGLKTLLVAALAWRGARS
ncbi:MAG: DUF4149 domain-containing protein [Methylibium sp.]|nr:DUF4149 domain-containing protein [Methylibium sp.]